MDGREREREKERERERERERGGGGGGGREGRWIHMQDRPTARSPHSILALNHSQSIQQCHKQLLCECTSQIEVGRCRDQPGRRGRLEADCDREQLKVKSVTYPTPVSSHLVGRVKKSCISSW